MTILVWPLTNTAYGFPRGKPRRVKPVALACVHITGNRDTASNPNLRDAARDERHYANRAGSGGPSAHYYVARDGWAIEAVSPDRFAAWSNGDVSTPNIANPGIRRVIAMRAKGYNANEAYWLEFENVGHGSLHPITTDQVEFMAQRIAAFARVSGLPISRETVHGHWEINGVDRRNCPIAFAKREGFLGKLVSRARAILSTMMEVDVLGFRVPDRPQTVRVAAGAKLYHDAALTRLAATIPTTAARLPMVGRYNAIATMVIFDVDNPSVPGSQTVFVRTVDTSEMRDMIADAIAADRARAKIVYS